MREVDVKGTIVRVDNRDYDAVSAHKWQACKVNHGKSIFIRKAMKVDGKVKWLPLGKYILSLCGMSAKRVSYINGNTLDNRRCNLLSDGEPICDRGQRRLDRKLHVDGCRFGFRNREFQRLWYDRHKNEELFKIRKAVKDRFKKARRAVIGRAVSTSSLDILGCTIEEFRDHLKETALQNGYSDYVNYDPKKYHIDYIIPVSRWNLTCGYHQRLCQHYSNLQILSVKDNLTKGNRD